MTGGDVFMEIPRNHLVEGQKNVHQPIFPYNIIKDSPASLAHNSVFIDPNNLKFVLEIRFLIL